MHTKRLMIPLLLIAVILAAAPPPAYAQSKEIAGSWTLDAAKSGGSNGPPMMILTIKGNDFTARMGAATAPEMSFKLDGTETVMPEGEKTKAVWKDGKLSASVVNKSGTPTTVTFSREGEWLVLEAPPGGRGPMKLYFKKTPAKL